MSAIESVLVENRVFPPPEAVVKAARISGMPAYEALCAEAERDFEGFWARLARENLVWNKPFTRVLDECYDRLLAQATVTSYLVILAERTAAERLRSMS